MGKDMPAPFEPVSPEDLARLRELHIASRGLADRLMALEIEWTTIVAAGRRVRDDELLLYRRIANERGIPETTVMDINPRSGEVVTLSEEEVRQGAMREDTGQPTPAD